MEDPPGIIKSVSFARFMSIGFRLFVPVLSASSDVHSVIISLILAKNPSCDATTATDFLTLSGFSLLSTAF
jgi:hypothetical protein